MSHNLTSILCHDATAEIAHEGVSIYAQNRKWWIFKISRLERGAWLVRIGTFIDMGAEIRLATEGSPALGAAVEGWCVQQPIDVVYVPHWIAIPEIH